MPHAPVVRKCFSCRYRSDDPMGQCRRFLPTIYTELRTDAWGKLVGETTQGWPWVSDTEWCGEHKFDKRKFAAYVLTK